MKFNKRMMVLATAVALLTALAATPAMGATRKKISSISVSVKSEIEPETDYGDETIDVITKGGKYHYDTYEIENEGSGWLEDDIPQISIYLRAEEGYYFSLTTASAVKLSGATYVKAVKQDSSETLKLTVKLPSLAEQVANQGDVDLADNGYATWEAVRGAGSYELRVYRNGSAMGVTLFTTPNNYYNLKDVITREGDYYVKVRPVNKINQNNKGEWGISPSVYINAEQAERIRTGQAGGIPVQGTWKQTDNRWWYQHDDGSYTKNNWEEIKGQWYFFDADGYMKTGWIEWEGKKYYCAESGEMLRNTTTPDGFIVGDDGSPKTD